VLSVTNTDGSNQAYGYFDDAAITLNTTYGATTTWAEFNDDLYFNSGKCLLKVDNSDGAADLVMVMPETITCLTPFSDNNLYICQGWSNAYYEMDTSEAFTVNTLANNTMKYMAFVRTDVDTMYASDSLNTIRSTTNPADGGVAWSAQTIVDTSYNDITGLLSYDNSLYIMKEDRPYYIDSSGNVQTLTNITASLKSSTGGTNPIEWLGKVYMHYGTHGLLEYDAGDFRWLNPAEYTANNSTYSKQIVATWGDSEYLYTILSDTDTILLSGRDEVIDGTSRWVWHPLNYISNYEASTITISNVYAKRLYFGGASASDGVKYITIASDANPTSNSFTSGGYIISPYYHADYLGDLKAWIKNTLTMSGTTTTIYFTVAYQKLGDASWTTIGTFKTSPRTSNYIPVDASSNKPISVWMRFKITLTTGTAGTTPILKDFDVRGILYPSRRKMINLAVRCADNIVDKEGTPLGITATGITTVIDEAADATYPVAFYDLYGSTKYVKVLPTQPYAEVRLNEKNHNPELWYYLKLQEITIS
jgi:hypothetical protein